MDMASRLIGIPSYKRKAADQEFAVSPSKSRMRTHSYAKLMEKSKLKISLYDKTFGFANSPLKKTSRISKNKRRSLEITRLSALDQREQYQHLIDHYRAPNLQERIKCSDEDEQVAKNISIVDLTKLPSNDTPGKSLTKHVLQNMEENNLPSLSHDNQRSVREKVPYSSFGAREKPIAIKDFVSPFLSENFIPNIMKTYNHRERQRQMQLSAEEKRAKMLREKREAKEVMLSEILQSKLEIKESPKLPELTSVMKEVINNAFEVGPRQEILTENFNISITREHISTLFGLRWLNDEIVNFYMELIVQRSKDCKDLPSVHAMNTFFYPKLSKQAYNSVRRWTKKVDIFSKDLVFYPIHLGVHWCLAIVDFKRKQIRYYDSMGGENYECLQILRDYLLSEHKNKKGTEYDLSGWELESMLEIPQQMNGSDCGVFACKFAEYISLDMELSFTQDDMPYFRRAMVWEILNKKLLR